MTVVLTDQEIDRAEAFRLAKRLPLPPEVVLSSDSGVIRFRTFACLYGIEDSMIIQRILGSKLRMGIAASTGASGASYADRLSHVCDLDDPVSFVDLRAALPADPPASPPGIPDPVVSP